MAGEDPELVEIQPGQTIAVRLNAENQVKRFIWINSTTVKCHSRRSPVYGYGGSFVG